MDGQSANMVNNYLGFLGIKQEAGSFKSELTLNEYERMMNSGELLENMRFSQGVNTEGLKVMDGEVEVVLPKKEISPRYESSLLRGNLLNRYYAVKVIGVDRKKKCVTVSHVEAQREVRPGVIRQIESVLGEGRDFKTHAVVRLFSRSNTMAFVDILGLGIQGMVLAKDWSVSYVSDIAAVARRGDIEEIAIIGHTNKHSDTVPQYLCSRKAILEKRDLWKGIEERVPYNSTVLVRCVKKEVRNFVGKIAGLDEISAYCFYPDKPSARTGEPIVIQQGGLYSAYVAAVSETNRILRLRVLDEFESIGNQ